MIADTVTKDGCTYTCEANKICKSKYGRSFGACVPPSFGNKCFGIPSQCQDCNQVVNCDGGSSG